MNAIGVVLALFALVVVAVIAYRAGYLRAEAELVRQRQPTTALPRWRQVAGWAAYTCSGLLLCLFLFLAFRYAKAWGWTVSLTAWGLWFALFLGGIWLGGWCWKPYREALERQRSEENRVVAAIDTRKRTDQE
jgi:ABC-type polysaccharide/polyol phosphate export permease